MGPADDEGQDDISSTKPRYEGEDCRPTSQKELFGFYSYSCAAEVVVIVAVSSFMPITLEELARGRGHLQSDKNASCIAAAKGSQCLVPFLGSDINTASFAMYTFAISVGLQALLVISMSGMADHGHYRKMLLLSFAATGAVALMLFLPINSDVYVLGALWAIIINVCLGASFVLLNAYLPLLVRWHPTLMSKGHSPTSDDVRRESSAPIQADDEDEALARSTSRLLPGADTELNTASPAAPAAEMQLATRLSSNGIGFGYLAALVVQLMSIGIVISTGSSSFSLRLVLFGVGIWWLLLSLPAAYCLRPRPGPPLDSVVGSISLASSTSNRSWISYLTYSWRNLYHTALRARRLKDVLLFLSAWFLISDAIATVSGTAILFAKTTLGMKPASLAFINVVATCFGVVGAFTWSRLSRKFNLSPTRTILACTCLFELIPIYGLLGFIPAVRRAGVFGLQQPWEMYPLGAVYGFVLGGLSSYCRGVFGELIPEGSEAAFYALYAVTDKGSSVFGPAVVGAITDATGDIRPAFWFLALLIGIPALPMWFVDLERGRREAAKTAKESRHHLAEALQDDEGRSTVR